VACYRTTTRARALQSLQPQLLRVSKVQDVDPQHIRQGIHGFGAEAATRVEEIRMREVAKPTSTTRPLDPLAEVDLAKEYSLLHDLDRDSLPPIPA